MTVGAFDLVVRGATVVTESGRRRADVGIRGGRICTVGDVAGGAPQEIDAAMALLTAKR